MTDLLKAANGLLKDRQSPSPGTHTPYRGSVADNVGYETVQFAGKRAQQSRVEDAINEKGFMPKELVNGEVTWFYDNLGIDDTYFKAESVDTIASHIISLYGSKILSYTETDQQLNIRLEKSSDERAVYIHSSEPGVTNPNGKQYEDIISTRYLNDSNPKKAYRLETYRSTGKVSSTLAQQLRCYFVSRCDFVDPEPKAGESDIRKVSDKSFLEKVSENTLAIYQEVMSHTLERYGAVVECFEVEGSRERRLVIGYKQGSTQHFFSAMSKLYHWYGVYSTRKYVEQFSNGITLMSFYLHPLRGPPIESSIFQIAREASLIYCLPNNQFFNTTTALAAQEASYAYAGYIFAQHFLNRLGAPYMALKHVLNENDAAQATVLQDIRTKLRQETYTRQSIEEVLHAYPGLVRLLYIQFALVHYVSGADQLVPTLSYQRLQTDQPLDDEQLYNKIKKTVTDKQHFQVIESLYIFNKAVLKTNFYQPTKVALSFRLDPSFLPASEYPKQPYGVFLVVGSEFRGFHVRFKDVARGGIRIIRSRNREAFSINQRNLFDENYGLASTQASKNKDIPEGGSKGTILPDLNAAPRVCFEKYVDAILDLLIPGKTPGIKEEIVDLHKKDEILFFGPDEGTADMMDWAALHARSRGAPFWKSFTTGKSPLLGGIAHDTYGMTSLSVRQYVIGIYRMLGLKESEITKVQTGGPDGDLGSNEILLSKDKTIAIIDGSGVLHDPLGLDRSELVRLARDRKMIIEFDSSKISKEGYKILVTDQDFTLPNGEVVADGEDFRNRAHLRYKADMFVPCGGRPDSVNVSNVHNLWDAEGKPNFKYIVEGANLFISHGPRLALEKKGVILFKDASANKGGVTSSGLAFTDAEFLEQMTTHGDEGVSDFYADYVQEIQRTISMNAKLEFECIWKESLISNKPRATLTDEVGQTLIQLQDQLEESELWNNQKVREAVLSLAIPKPLLKEIGLKTLLERLPAIYARSLFAAYISSHYIYKYGMRASPVDFYSFIDSLKGPAAQQ